MTTCFEMLLRAVAVSTFDKAALDLLEETNTTTNRCSIYAMDPEDLADFLLEMGKCLITMGDKIPKARVVFQIAKDRNAPFNKLIEEHAECASALADVEKHPDSSYYFLELISEVLDVIYCHYKIQATWTRTAAFVPMSEIIDRLAEIVTENGINYDDYSKRLLNDTSKLLGVPVSMQQLIFFKWYDLLYV